MSEDARSAGPVDAAHEVASQTLHEAVWALVPVKCFSRGKSRLTGVLDAQAREDLARAFSSHVLGVLAACDAIAGTLVVTDCAEVEREARDHGAEVMRDGAEGSLAAIVDHALAVLARRGVRGAIVLMSDLPWLEVDEVRRLALALRDAPIVLAPDRHDEGTNALGLAPPDRMPTCFGTRGSFTLHRERARATGLAIAIHQSEGVALDVDSPEDLALAGDYALGGAPLRWKRKRPSRVSAA
jgi:2-phospho-L-lactate guanylyltransferase